MDSYHGTAVGGLTELKPFNSQHSNLNESCVYLTSNKQLALHYIWDLSRCPNKSPMLDILKDGTLVFQEMFSGALAFFYKGLSGYIYHCIGDYEISEKIGVIDCAKSNEPVSICDFEYIDDVYERIMEYEKAGQFVYEKFESLPQYRHDIIRGIICRSIKRNALLANPDTAEARFVQEKYSQYWKEADVLSKHGLL
jgi:hypothetical protein